MDAENLIVILGVRALSAIGSLYRFVATSAQLLEALRLLLLESGSFLQKSCKFSCGSNALLKTRKKSIDTNLQLLVQVSYTSKPREPTSDCKTLSTTGEDSVVGRLGCRANVVGPLVGTSFPPLFPDPFSVDCGTRFSEEECSSEYLCSIVRCGKV